MSSGSLWSDYLRGSRFFMEQGEVYETLRRLVERLREEGLDYALIDAMALVAHGYRRFTEDVDVLMRKETLDAFRERLLGRGYTAAFPGASRTFRDAETGVKIEFVTSGEYPGDGKPKPVAFPDPVEARVEREGLWLVTLEKLVELKLASGLSAPHRLKDPGRRPGADRAAEAAAGAGGPSRPERPGRIPAAVAIRPRRTRGGMTGGREICYAGAGL